MFSLDHLSATEFEEFSYDLLCSLGYKNLSWRKGTGLDASPSDQGRDLEAVEEVREPDGKIRLDHWFVECKHHKRGIPPERLESALAWASAESPDYLLFICSNFLSNPAKNYLERYECTNKPSFKVRVWERKDLEALCAGKHNLLHKFKLSADVPGLDYANPNHLTYVLSPQLNSLGFLFECLEQLDPKRRDLALDSVYHEVVSPRFREPIHPNETLAEMMLEPVNYESFRAAMRRHAKSGNDISIVHNVVSRALSWLLHSGNPSSVSKTKEFMRDAQSYFAAQAEAEEDDEQKKTLEGMVTKLDQEIATAEARAKEAYELYIYVCEALVPRLLTERPKMRREEGKGSNL